MVLSTCTNTPNDTDSCTQSRQQVQITHLPCSQTVRADDNVCFQNAPPLGLADSEMVLSLRERITDLEAQNKILLQEKADREKAMQTDLYMRSRWLGDIGKEKERIVPADAPEHMKDLAIALRHATVDHLKTSIEDGTPRNYSKRQGIALLYDFVDQYCYRDSDSFGGIHANASGLKVAKSTSAAAFFESYYFESYHVRELPFRELHVRELPLFV